VKKVFFVSREFPFHLVIYPGSGPEFGRSYGWPIATVDEIGEQDADALVIENRLRESDVSRLDRFLAEPARRRPPLFLKVSDPEMPLSNDVGVRWILAQRDRPGVHFLSVYEPRGPLADALRGLRVSRVVRAPYPYERRREVDRAVAERRRRLFLSGARSRRLYPSRSALVRRRAWNPILRAAVARLRHPGYPDLGATPRHDVVREKYVDLAARHTHFFLDPSRYGVELMKYVECAYAGCVPLGELPTSLEPIAGGAFVRWNGSTLSLLRELRGSSEGMRAAAQRYRETMRAARDPRVLDAEVDRQLAIVLR